VIWHIMAWSRPFIAANTQTPQSGTYPCVPRFGGYLSPPGAPCRSLAPRPGGAYPRFVADSLTTVRCCTCTPHNRIPAAHAIEHQALTVVCPALPASVRKVLPPAPLERLTHILTLSIAGLLFPLFLSCVFLILIWPAPEPLEIPTKASLARANRRQHSAVAWTFSVRDICW
jgi:hypothetical protein